MPLDLLSPADRAYLVAVLQEMYEPLGMTEFIVVALSPSGNVFTSHVGPHGEPDRDAGSLAGILRAVSEGLPGAEPFKL